MEDQSLAISERLVHKKGSLGRKKTRARRRSKAQRGGKKTQRPHQSAAIARPKPIQYMGSTISRKEAEASWFPRGLEMVKVGTAPQDPDGDPENAGHSFCHSRARVATSRCLAFGM